MGSEQKIVPLGALTAKLSARPERLDVLAREAPGDRRLRHNSST